MKLKSIVILMVLVLSMSAQASAYPLLEPSQYGENQCELIAKAYQEIYFGSLVFIQPLDDRGQYVFEAYSGHWINRIYQKQAGIIYFDYATNTTLKSKEEVLDWYEVMTGKEAAIFDLAEGHPPFPLVWQY